MFEAPWTNTIKKVLIFVLSSENIKSAFKKLFLKEKRSVTASTVSMTAMKPSRQLQSHRIDLILKWQVYLCCSCSCLLPLTHSAASALGLCFLSAASSTLKSHSHSCPPFLPPCRWLQDFFSPSHFFLIFMKLFSDTSLTLTCSAVCRGGEPCSRLTGHRGDERRREGAADTRMLLSSSPRAFSPSS